MTKTEEEIRETETRRKRIEERKEKKNQKRREQ